jgi:long-chain acyl-CoA synthetase
VSKEEVRTLCAIPLNHIYGFNANVNVCLLRAGVLSWCAAHPGQSAGSHRTPPSQHLAAVPAMIIGLNNHPKIASADITSLKGIFCGSAPLR